MGFTPSELAEKLTSPRPPLTPKQALLVTGRMKILKLTELCRRELFLFVRNRLKLPGNRAARTEQRAGQLSAGAEHQSDHLAD